MDSPYALSKIMIKNKMDNDKSHNIAYHICGHGNHKIQGKSKHYTHLTNKHFIPKSMKKHKIDKEITYVIGDLKPKYAHLHGSGLSDFFKSGFKKVGNSVKSSYNYLKDNVTANDIKNLASKAVDMYSNKTGTFIKNLIPGSDENATRSHVGEKHAILKLPNNQHGIASYMGPGTDVITRLKKGDKPRTLADKVAQRHDIDYMLSANASTKAEQEKLIREADRRMINKLKQLEKDKSDDPFNIQIGMKAIQGKVLGEDLGILPKDEFSGNLKTYTDHDLDLLLKNRDQLQLEGYGKIDHKLINKFRNMHDKYVLIGGNDTSDFFNSFAAGFLYPYKKLGGLISAIPGVGTAVGPIIQTVATAADSLIDPKYKVLDRAFGAGKRKRGRPRKTKQ